MGDGTQNQEGPHLYRGCRMSVSLSPATLHGRTCDIPFTNHDNYLAVFNNVTSPFFGRFAGFQHRVNGFVLKVVK